MENKDNNVELKDLKKVEEGQDEVDKKEEKENLVESDENDDKQSDISSIDNPTETCNKIWEAAFNKLAKTDGEDDGKIELKSLVKWITSLDLNSKIEFEKNLEISPKHIERIVRKVSENVQIIFHCLYNRV